MATRRFIFDAKTEQMLIQSEMETFASEWIEAWNDHDLERVLSHYSSDIEFSSPFIVNVVGEPLGRLHGKDALQAYWTKALARLPALRFKLSNVLWGVNSIVINYEREDGRFASEWFEFGDD